MAEEKKTKPKAKPRAKKEDPEVVAPPKPATNHTLKEVCAAGVEYKAKHNDFKNKSYLNSIKRLSDDELAKAHQRLVDARAKVDQLTEEYINQTGADKRFAKKHHGALPPCP